MDIDWLPYHRGCQDFYSSAPTMSVAEVLYHWWMWAYHKGAASYFRAMTFDA